MTNNKNNKKEAMTDIEMIDRVAELWIYLGGDAESMGNAWVRLRDAVKRKLDGLEKYNDV